MLTYFAPLFHTSKAYTMDKSGEEDLWNLNFKKEVNNKYMFKSEKHLRPEYRNEKFLNKGG